MKIQISRSLERGGVLLTTIVVTGLIGIALLSYLELVVSQNTATERSQTWNSAMPLAEAGIEEALSQLHRNGPSSLGGGLFGNLAADGWTLSGGLYVKQRNVDPDSYYVVSIAATVPPVVTSQGYVRMPSTSNYISRSVRITTTNSALFLKGILVSKGINSNGNSTTADAFDSGNPLYSTNGQYIASKATDGGGIATLSGLANQINFGSGTIYGPVSTGPGGSIPAGLNVGTHSWLASNSGIEPGFFTTDMNVTLFPVPTPTFAGVPPAGGTIAGVTYTYILSSGNWTMNSGSFSGKVLVTGNANLYVTSAASVNFAPATGSITIASNASLTMYVGSGNTVLPNLVNGSGVATNFTYFGLPTNTNITQQVNADFNGLVYAPNAKYTLGGNGTGSEQKVLGAIIANSVNYNDFFTFHYDLALRFGMSRAYVMTSWDEL